MSEDVGQVATLYTAVRVRLALTIILTFDSLNWKLAIRLLFLHSWCLCGRLKPHL